jgi:hypothetical protein
VHARKSVDRKIMAWIANSLPLVARNLCGEGRATMPHRLRVPVPDRLRTSHRADIERRRGARLDCTSDEQVLHSAWSFGARPAVFMPVNAASNWHIL